MDQRKQPIEFLFDRVAARFMPFESATKGRRDAGLGARALQPDLATIAKAGFARAHRIFHRLHKRWKRRKTGPVSHFVDFGASLCR